MRLFSWSGLSKKFNKRNRSRNRQQRGRRIDTRRQLLVERLDERAVLSALSSLGGLGNPNENVNSSLTPTQLAELLLGPGVSVSNVTFTGGVASTGSFDFSDPTVIGFDKGILLSSGSAADIVGPNAGDSTSTDFTLPGDVDLSTLSGFDTHDAAVLEFDFVPTANQVVFQYAFASDEYPEWVNTPFNDVFAFFVNGTNYATVRQTAGDPNAPFVPVAVNNINNGNPEWYPDFVPQRPDLFRPNYVNPIGPSAIDLELDGITKVLTFQAPVVPGEINHMKLAIADASDGIYDSAVFIQAGSLVSNENPVADLSMSPSQGSAPLTVTAIVEGEDPNGLPLTYSIDWGDGTVSSGPLDQPSTDSEKTALVDHTYMAGGSYIVTLTVSSGALSGTSVEDVDVTSSVKAAPVVTVGPLNQSVVEGELFTFTASATGSPAPDVQWQLSTDGGVTFADIPGATQAIYSATASLAQNANEYRAVFTNSEGSATTTAATLTVTALDATPPAAPGVALTQDTGNSSADNITNLGLLALSNIEPGASVEYSTDNGVTWSSGFTAAEGANSIQVRQTDLAGNVSPVTTLTFTLDTLSPSAPGVSLAQDTGISSTDGITNVGALSLSGIETGASVEYSTDNGVTWSSSFSAAEGPNTVAVRQSDTAGNVSGIAMLSFTLHTAPPEVNPTFSTTQPILVGATGITVSPNASDSMGVAFQTSGAIDTTTAGKKTVVCTATDIAGNTTSVSVSYMVGYAFANVSPQPGAIFKRTSTINVSFQLRGSNGVISDQAAANLLSNIVVTFDGVSAGSVKYNKRTHTFSLAIKLVKPTVGDHNLAIHVTMGAEDVAAMTIPLKIV